MNGEKSMSQVKQLSVKEWRELLEQVEELDNEVREIAEQLENEYVLSEDFSDLKDDVNDLEEKLNLLEAGEQYLKGKSDTLVERADFAESVLRRGFFGRLKWLLTGLTGK